MNPLKILEQYNINIKYTDNSDELDLRAEDRENTVIPNEGVRKRKKT
jgi:hypothetical protein